MHPLILYLMKIFIIICSAIMTTNVYNALNSQLKNTNICIHENKIRGGSELKQKVGDFKHELISLQHGYDNFYMLLATWF